MESSLKLTKLDIANIIFDSRQCPNTIFLEARLDGHLNLDNATSALKALSAKYPRVCGFINQGKPKHLVIPDGAKSPELTIIKVKEEEFEVTINKLIATYLDPNEGILKLVLLSTPVFDSLVFLAHHAGFDGLSTLFLLFSFLSLYSNTDCMPQLPEIFIKGKTLEIVSDKLKRPINFIPFISKPTRLGDPNSKDGHSNVKQYRLEQDLLFNMSNFAASKGATINDIILAAFSLAVDDYCKEFDKPLCNTVITMPVNLRNNPKEILGNYSYTTSISLRKDERSSLDKALTTVANQTKIGKYNPRNNLTDIFDAVFSRKITLKLLMLIKKLFGKRLVHTCLISNLSEFPHYSFNPELKLAQLYFAPPVSSPRNLAIGVITYNKYMHFSFRYLSPALNDHEVSFLAKSFIDKLQGLQN